MPKTSRLNIRLDRDVIDLLTKRAEELGFEKRSQFVDTMLTAIVYSDVWFIRDYFLVAVMRIHPEKFKYHVSKKS